MPKYEISEKRRTVMTHLSPNNLNSQIDYLMINKKIKINNNWMQIKCY